MVAICRALLLMCPCSLVGCYHPPDIRLLQHLIAALTMAVCCRASTYQSRSSCPSCSCFCPLSLPPWQPAASSTAAGSGPWLHLLLGLQKRPVWRTSGPRGSCRPLMQLCKRKLPRQHTLLQLWTVLQHRHGQLHTSPLCCDNSYCAYYICILFGDTMCDAWFKEIPLEQWAQFVMHGRPTTLKQ